METDNKSDLLGEINKISEKEKAHTRKKNSSKKESQKADMEFFNQSSSINNLS